MNKKARVGLVIVLGGGLFILVIFLVANRSFLLSDRFELRSEFNQVAGLRAGAGVQYQGVSVGTVSAVTLPVAPGAPIEVTMGVSWAARHLINSQTQAQIKTEGMLGSMIVVLVNPPMPPDMPDPLPVEDGATISGEDPTDLFEITDKALEFGAARLEQLPWPHLVDAYACIMCNRCQDVCPAYVTGKELSPAALEVNKRFAINEQAAVIAAGGETPPLLDYAISESAVWACTACGACIDICPVGNEPMFDIMHLRRYQALTEDSFPATLQQAYRGIERQGNPWNQSARDRLAWAEGLAVPTVEEEPEADILWWVGCAPSYDPRARETARAFAKVLNHAGVRYAVLGEMESCSGDAARRSGREDLFWGMAESNMEVLNEVGPRRIVTTCPHCLHSIGKEYHQYDRGEER